MKHPFTDKQEEILTQICAGQASVDLDTLLDRSGRYIQELLKSNRAIHLISHAGDLQALAAELFVTSLPILQFLPTDQGATVIDLGSGGGFPAIPLKLSRPELHCVLIESRERKCLFLESIVRRLELSQIEIINSRFEDYSPSGDRRAITITSRAGPPLDIVLLWAAKLTGLTQVIVYDTASAGLERDLATDSHGFYLDTRLDIESSRGINDLQLLVLKLKSIKSS